MFQINNFGEEDLSKESMQLYWVDAEVQISRNSFGLSVVNCFVTMCIVEKHYANKNNLTTAVKFLNYEYNCHGFLLQ